MEKNMKIYEAGRSVPKEAQKEFNNGRFSGTDINPMWRIKKLTEIFGPAGVGWYVGDVNERAEEHGDVTMAIVNLNLYVKISNDEWSKPIYGTGGNVLLQKGKPSDEGYKMAYTDALSVACKALGIGADIYFQKDATKYTAKQTATEPEPTLVCSRCGKKIVAVKNSKGQMQSPAEQVAYSRKEFGHDYCLKCSKEAYMERRVEADKALDAVEEKLEETA